MKVLVDSSESIYGLTIVQNEIDGGLYLLSPCCRHCFDIGPKCSRCRASWYALESRLGIDLEKSVYPRDVDAVGIQLWAGLVLGRPVSVEVKF